jgi:hypothetical protein
MIKKKNFGPQPYFLIIVFPWFICLQNVAGFNHPEISWRTAESDHFTVHFYENTEPFVSPAIAIAEEVYPPLNEIYGFITSKKINLVLADYDDFTNGFTDWLGGGIIIWTPDGAFPFRGNTTWLRNVLTHELTHLVTMRKRPGMQMMDLNVTATIVNPGMELQIGRTLPTMNFFPNWFAEGLAQIGAYRHGCDCWDNRRDMVLRCAALNGSLLSLDHMGVFTHDQQGNEMVYNQGFSLAMHIEKQVGSEEIHRLLRAESDPCRPFAQFDAGVATTFSRRQIESYYREWRDSLSQAARKAIPLQPTETHSIWRNGKINMQPRSMMNRGYKGWLTSNGDDSYRTDLVIFKKGITQPVRTIKHAESSWEFSPSGDAVYYVNSFYPGAHGSYFKELYRCDLETGKTERLTRNGRIYAVAASPSGQELTAIRFRGDRFSLERFDLATRVFTEINTGNPGDPFIALDYDPNNESRLIVERVVRGRSALYLIDLGKKNMQRISPGTGQEQSPQWGTNNRIYFSADYDGIFNIYSILPDGTDLMRYTTVVGGAFDPQSDEETQALYFSEYTSAGYGIVTVPLECAAYSVPRGKHCAFLPLTGYSGGLSVSRPYGLRMLRAYWESKIDFVSNGSNGGAVNEWMLDIGVLRTQTDALNRFFLFTGADAATQGVMGQSLLSNGERLHLNENRVREQGNRLNRWVRYIDSSAAMSHTQIDRIKRRVQPDLPQTESNDPGSQSENSTGGASPLLFFVPQIGIASTAFPSSLQLSSMLQTLNMFPTILSTQLDLTQQTTRSTYAGLSFVTELIIPKLLARAMRESDTVMRNLDETLTIAPAGAALPLWFGWQDMGYYNEDISYNGNGLWSAKLSITPSYMISIIDSGRASFDSSAVKGISAVAEFFHGFPIDKYTGIPVSVSTGLYYYKFPVNATWFEKFDLDGNSDIYVTGNAMASLNFPLFRQINTGRRLFFDALYGRIGYNLLVEANRAFMVKTQDQGDDWATFIGRSLTTNDSDNGLRVAHWIFLGGTINTVSEYIFNGGINLIVAYDILSQGAAISVSGLF